MIIRAGIYRNRLIKVPDSKITRVTSDKVRQAIFNIIGEKISDANLLDLFSGSGLIGIEALSRGAKKVIFNDYKTTKIISDNLKALDINQLVIGYSYLDALRKIAKEDVQFDIVYLDPPYDFKDYDKVLNSLNKYNLLATDSLIFIETDKKTNIDDENFDVKVYNYGNIKLNVLRRKI